MRETYRGDRNFLGAIAEMKNGEIIVTIQIFEKKGEYNKPKFRTFQLNKSTITKNSLGEIDGGTVTSEVIAKEAKK